MSEPGQDAMTLKPKMSKNGVADNVLPAGSLRTKSQWFDCKGVSLYICDHFAVHGPDRAELILNYK